MKIVQYILIQSIFLCSLFFIGSIQSVVIIQILGYLTIIGSVYILIQSICIQSLDNFKTLDTNQSDDVFRSGIGDLGTSIGLVIIGYLELFFSPGVSAFIILIGMYGTLMNSDFLLRYYILYRNSINKTNNGITE